MKAYNKVLSHPNFIEEKINQQVVRIKIPIQNKLTDLEIIKNEVLTASIKM
ncbi:hypothetical protein LCGC14_1152540 [marine sediment metagenome]|uniref:Uncharacterized protein n=1 Tax=marine sediment metagenome TaxID=412755 RepID=A0A0F9Q0K0_9ZZZZ